MVPWNYVYSPFKVYPTGVKAQFVGLTSFNAWSIRETIKRLSYFFLINWEFFYSQFCQYMKMMPIPEYNLCILFFWRLYTIRLQKYWDLWIRLFSLKIGVYFKKQILRVCSDFLKTFDKIRNIPKTIPF